MAAGGSSSADLCHLKASGEKMRALLGDADAPLKLRVEAWCVHAEVCLRLQAVDELRVSMRYAVRHLAGLERAGVRVAEVLARAPGALLAGSGPALEGMCGMSWPLRAAGLAAAAAICQRQGVPGALGKIAEQASTAFKEECGFTAGKGQKSTGLGAGPACEPSLAPWPLSPGAYRAKRRRLLEGIAHLPEASALADDGSPGVAEPGKDAELAQLCAAALVRIRAWSQQS
mmetsp:Transcript_87730/g.274836  ORF Transcript_87730/g.274836 Transcript_87730/m.274836 type:complete len:230 (-) Transcript_87730:184-873(-)